MKRKESGKWESGTKKSTRGVKREDRKWAAQGGGNQVKWEIFFTIFCNMLQSKKHKEMESNRVYNVWLEGI